MRFKFLYYFLIILISPLNTPLLSQSSEISEVFDDQTLSIDIDYLDKLPKNKYLIGSGDILGIIIANVYPELDRIVTIDGEGTIYLPRLGRIYVKGLTLKELSFLLNKAYKKYLKYPAIEIEILSYRPIKVLVDGEVVNPGLVSLKGSMALNDSQESFKERRRNNELTKTYDKDFIIKDKVVNYYFPTVFDAIRQSGGITKYTDLSNIKVIRKNNLSKGAGKIFTTLNFEKVLEGDVSQNIRIYDADIIRLGKLEKANELIFRKATLSNINPKFSNVIVLGRVEMPGNQKVPRSGTLTDAISIAGGAKVIKGPLRFLRYNNDGTIEKRVFRFNAKAKRGTYKNPYLIDGDLIVVGNSFLSNTTEVLSEITAPINGIFSSYALLKMITN